jgi:hypothetical protein
VTPSPTWNVLRKLAAVVDPGGGPREPVDTPPSEALPSWDDLGRIAKLLRLRLDGTDLRLRPVDLTKAYIVRSLNQTANKPLHLGHLRNGLLGAATAGALEALGARVVRHCVVEDTGRFMTEAMAAIADFETSHDVDAVAVTFSKPDHFIGHCYADYRRKITGGAPAGTGYEARNDDADSLQRRLTEGDEEARRLWAKVRTMTLTGQEATLQSLGLRFDCVDYESVEDPLINGFLSEGYERGIYERTEVREVFFKPTVGAPLRLVNGAGLPEESTRLLSFIRRLLAGWPGGRVNVIIAGNEWKSSMEVYPELLQKLGVKQIYDMYAQAFYGMVMIDGKKMSSSDGSGVLVDELLRQVALTGHAQELAAKSGGKTSATDVAATVVKGLLLATGRPEPIDFSLELLLDRRSNPGWTLAAAWTSMPVGRGAGKSEALSPAVASVLRDALSRVSFEAAVLYSLVLAQSILAGTATKGEQRDFRSVTRALALAPGRSTFVFDGARQLTAAPTIGAST